MKNKINIVLPPSEEMPKAVREAIHSIWSKVGKIPTNISDICYTYGEICFSPRSLTRDLIVHESTHTEQQGLYPDKWWEQYGKDPEFRYSQELEAYQAQYRYVLSVYGRGKALNYAKAFARDMSSDMYGKMCSYEKALMDILRY